MREDRAGLPEPPRVAVSRKPVSRDHLKNEMEVNKMGKVA